LGETEHVAHSVAESVLVSESESGPVSESKSESEPIAAPLRVVSSWDQLDLPSDLLRGIYAYGFEKPSAIQSQAIAPLMQGKDLLAQAQSGTGKTGTFAVGALTRIDVTQATTQVLMLAPTHELAHQIAGVVKALGSMMTGLVVQTVIGGTSVRDVGDQLRSRPPHVAVGCPGRVFDLLQRGHLRADSLRLAVLDEADEMLSSGFQDQVRAIFEYFPATTQIALFSATLPEHIVELTKQFLRHPVQIQVKAEQLTLEGIRQYYVAFENDRDKYEALKDLYQYLSVAQCIVYANSVVRVRELYDNLKRDGFPVACLHSELERLEREQVIEDFRSGSARVLVSSNVSSRGFDVQQVNMVINFDLPRDVHTYLHRIGRSGRWGRKGTGINFITPRDQAQLRDIETHYHTQITELPAAFHLA
jgi:translation initiation factor 4A